MNTHILFVLKSVTIHKLFIKKNSEKNEIVFQVRKEAAIISFIVGIVTSILGSIIYNMFLGN